MKFGVREICNVVFRAKSNVKIGETTFKVGQPVLYIDSAKTSTLEGAATTVYAQGGRGNTRLIAWEGEKTLTFTVEDALLSPIGFAILSGAGLIKKGSSEKVHVHTTSYAYADVETGAIDLKDVVGSATICTSAPLFVMGVEPDGSLNGTIYEATVAGSVITCGEEAKGKNVMVDFYVEKAGSDVSEIQIDAENFAGYYYVEADTLFRRQDNGVDMPAVITIPTVKIQSNFTFSMASSGDPSTFTFTMDAMPGYTYFDKTKKVICVIQIVEDAESSMYNWDSVMTHTEDEVIDVDGDGDDSQEASETHNGLDASDSFPYRKTTTAAVSS
jgi:hypothetical protein